MTYSYETYAKIFEEIRKYQAEQEQKRSKVDNSTLFEIFRQIRRYQALEECVSEE